MGKRNLYRKHLFSVLAPSIFVFFAISCTAATVVVLNSKKEASAKEIPDYFYDLSEDGKILYGFKPNIKQNDIYEYRIVKIPESVEVIQPYAFIYAFDDVGTNINQLVLNQNLKRIENGAFAYCNAFKTVNHFIESPERDASKLEYIGDEAFTDCYLDGDLYLPESIKHIGRRAFNNCKKIIGKIFLPKSIEKIDSYAFNNCSGVSQIDLSEHEIIPQWLKTANYIFNGVGLQAQGSRKIPLYIHNETLEEWEDCILNRQALPEEAAFSFDILNTLPEDKFKFNDKKDELLGFADEFDKETLKDYAQAIIPSSVKTIKANAFKEQIVNCRMTFNFAAVNKIEDSAFEGCTGLIGCIEPQSLKEIGKRAFYGCTGIQSVKLSSPIEILSDEMFKNCSNLASVELTEYTETDTNDDKEQKLGEGAFANCAKLREINLQQFSSIPTSWKKDEWSEQPFKNVALMGNVIVSPEFSTTGWDQLLLNCGLNGINSSKSYEDSEYWSIKQATPQIVCPDNYLTTTRSKQVLNGLTSLGIKNKKLYTTIFVPNSITNIYEGAFDGQFLFSSEEENFHYWNVVFNYGLLKIDNFAFRNNDGMNGSLFFPHELQYLGNGAFYNCNHIKGLFTLPDSVEHIGDYCFSGCELLYADTLMMPSKLSYFGNAPFNGMEIHKLSFQSPNLQFGHYCFQGISELSTIDANSWDYNAIKSQSSFFPDSLQTTQATGTIIVNSSGTQEEWNQLLKNDMGLPGGWTIQRNEVWNE
mgnify:CR=1 FL=1